MKRMFLAELYQYKVLFVILLVISIFNYRCFKSNTILVSLVVFKKPEAWLFVCL